MIEVSNCFSVFVLDWDDTLFPTTALRSDGVQQLSAYFARVDSLVSQLIEAALTVPNSCVLLLTNANIKWVYTGAEQFLPKVKALLQNAPEHLLVHSAQQKFDKNGRPLESGSLVAAQEAMTWKAQKVQSLLPTLHSMISTSCASSIQVLSVGDSMPDIELAHILAKLLSCQDERFIKTVAMKQHPTGGELVGELQALCRAFDSITTMRMSFHRSMFRQTPPQSRTPSPPPVQHSLNTTVPAQEVQDSEKLIDDCRCTSENSISTAMLESESAQSNITSASLSDEETDEENAVSKPQLDATGTKLSDDGSDNQALKEQMRLSTRHSSERPPRCNQSRRSRRRRQKGWQRMA